CERCPTSASPSSSSSEQGEPRRSAVTRLRLSSAPANAVEGAEDPVPEVVAHHEVHVGVVMEVVPAAGRAEPPALLEPRRQKMKLRVDGVQEDDEDHDLAERDREAPACDEDRSERRLDHEPGEQGGNARRAARTVAKPRGPCVAGVRIERVMPAEVKRPERAPREMREPVAGPE